jgi:hypothetical protein
LGRPISSRIFAPLLSARGVPASLAGAGLPAFLPAFASFFGARLALPPLAVFWPLGAPFFWVPTRAEQQKRDEEQHKAAQAEEQRKAAQAAVQRKATAR